jgi:hypothetical protein
VLGEERHVEAHEEEPEFYKENVRVKRLCFIHSGISLA